MASKTVFECDQCGVQTDADSAVNWIETRVAGLNAERCDRKPIEGTFCSWACLEQRAAEGKVDLEAWYNS